jgi:hypothetical protein
MDTANRTSEHSLIRADEVVRRETEPFVFTAGEQVFYGERLMPEPKRCPSCRKRRKKPINQVGPEVRHGQ